MFRHVSECMNGESFEWMYIHLFNNNVVLSKFAYSFIIFQSILKHYKKMF